MINAMIDAMANRSNRCRGGEGPILKAFMSCNLQWRYNGLKLRTVFMGASSLTGG